MPGPGYAVIDFETTGLFPGGHDRVIEVAVVHVEADGTISGQWDTLVNPGRDLGPQHIHHIQAGDILDAPTFAQIAARLVELLSGRVVVAHNASFDTRFLLAELGRLAYEPTISSLCTMQLAREFIPGAGRALKDCCDAYGIELENAHRASADTFATAQLLAAYLADSPDREDWKTHLASANSDWPPLVSSVAAWKPRPEHNSPAPSFLERISIKLPEFSGPEEHLNYLALLDRCLLDRQLSAHEANSLVELAEALGISRTTCAVLNDQYFEQLTSIAWADGVLTAEEVSDLLTVGGLLGLSDSVVAGAMQPRDVDVAPIATFSLEPGDLIVLTGDMVRDREDWHRELEARGFVPWTGVTKKVKLVAAADPDSLSGKARKARDYGIPIVGEQGLSDLLARL